MNKKRILLITTILTTILIIPATTAGILDWGQNTIPDNTTITLNKVNITVPQSPEATTNTTSTLDYYSYQKKDDKLDLEKADNFNTPGTATEYNDPKHKIQIMVINTTDAPHITSEDDGELSQNVEGEFNAYQYQRTLPGKVVLVWAYSDDSRELGKLIIDSASV